MVATWKRLPWKKPEIILCKARYLGIKQSLPYIYLNYFTILGIVFAAWRATSELNLYYRTECDASRDIKVVRGVLCLGWVWNFVHNELRRFYTSILRMNLNCVFKHISEWIWNEKFFFASNVFNDGKWSIDILHQRLLSLLPLKIIYRPELMHELQDAVWPRIP